MGHLHFLKEIDSDGILVTLASQKDLNEVAHDAELNQLARVFALVHRNGRIRYIAGLATGNKILLPDSLGHIRKRKGVQSPAHVPALVSIDKAADKQRIKRRSRYDTELAQPRHRICQAPIGHTHAHAALDDFGKLDHP